MYARVQKNLCESYETGQDTNVQMDTMVPRAECTHRSLKSFILSLLSNWWDFALRKQEPWHGSVPTNWYCKVGVTEQNSVESEDRSTEHWPYIQSVRWNLDRRSSYPDTTSTRLLSSSPLKYLQNPYIFFVMKIIVKYPTEDIRTSDKLPNRSPEFVSYIMQRFQRCYLQSI
jgi:hypothetical protein